MRLGLALLVASCSPPRRRRPTRSCSCATATSGSRRPTATERPLTAGGGYASPSMADDGTIVALRGRSFVRLRPDGAAIGSRRRVGGDWSWRRPVRRAGVARRLRSPTGSPAGGASACRSSPSCSLQDTDVTAYAYAGRVTDPLELGVGARPAASRRGTAPAARCCSATAPAPARPSRSTASARGEADDQGWFSYDDGTSLAQGQLDHARRPARGGRGRQGDPSVRRQPAAARAPGAALRRARRAVRVADVVARRHDARVGSRPTASTSPARCPTCAAPVPDCSVIRERRLAAGSDPYWGAADVPGATVGPAAARRAGGAQARARVPLAAGRAAPARPRGAAAAADRARAGARRRAAALGGTRAGRVLGAARGGDAARCGSRSTPRAARARARAGGSTLRARPWRAATRALRRVPAGRVRAHVGSCMRQRDPAESALPERRHADQSPQRTRFRSEGSTERTDGSTRPPGGSLMSKSRMVLVAAVAALAVMLIGGAGPAAAQTSTTPLTKTVKMTGTAKNGKKFNGTYTIKRFTHSGSKRLRRRHAEGQAQGPHASRKNNVAHPRHARAPAASRPRRSRRRRTPARSSTWRCSRSTSTCSGSASRTSRIELLDRGRARAPATCSATCCARSPASSTRRPRRRLRRRSSRRS